MMTPIVLRKDEQSGTIFVLHTKNIETKSNINIDTEWKSSYNIHMAKYKLVWLK